MALSSLVFAIIYFFVGILPAWLSEKPTLFVIETSSKTHPLKSKSHVDFEGDGLTHQSTHHEDHQNQDPLLQQLLGSKYDYM